MDIFSPKVNSVLNVTGSLVLTGSLTATGNIQAGIISGTFQGDGSGLTNTGISTSELYAHSFLLMGG